MTRIPASELGGNAEIAIGKQRIGALNKLFAYRYRGTRETYVFPDDDAGIEDLKILIHHYAWNNPLAIPRIIKLRAPWADAQAIIDEVEAYPRKWRSATLGKILNFTSKEWRRLRIRTIAPVDMSAEERRDYSRILSNGRRLKKRRMQGMQAQTGSLSRTKPWAAEGISRAQWYRRRGQGKSSPERETTLAAIKITGQTRPVSQGWAGLAVSSQESKREVGVCSPTSSPPPPDLCQSEDVFGAEKDELLKILARAPAFSAKPHRSLEAMQ